jgi:uncharacterized membrane protein YcaP (DUF421 family)
MEPVLRGAAIYLFLVVLFRILGKRSLAQITTFDFVVLLIVGEATQQALLGGDFSVTNGCLVVLTLIMLNVGLDQLKRWSPKVDRWLEDLPIVIVKDGKPIEERMKMVNVDIEDVLEAARHGQGLRSMDEIAYAVLERNGEVSVIARDKT